MAVTLTVLELSAALRIGDGATALDAPISAIMNRLLGAATAMVEEYAADAPEAVQNEAAVRAASYLYDNDGARNRRFSDVLAFSGAISILSPFRIQRAMSLDDVAAAVANGQTAGLSVAEVLALIAIWAREGNTDAIPADKLGNAGGAALDQVARDSAAAAQSTADTAQVEIDDHEGSQHNLDQVARNAASTAQTTGAAAQQAAASAQQSANVADTIANTATVLAQGAQDTADGKQDQLTDAQLHALAEAEGLDDKTADLVVVSDEEWANVAQDGSEGQITIFASAPSLTDVQDTGLTWVTRFVYNELGLGANHVAARVPAGTDPTARSTVLNNLRSRLSNWDLLGSDATYDYWTHRIHAHPGTLHFQIITSAEHFTEYDGFVSNARFTAPDGQGNLAGDVDTVQELVNAVDGLALGGNGGGPVTQAQVFAHLQNILLDGQGVYSEDNTTDNEITLNAFTVHPVATDAPTRDEGNDGDWWIQVNASDVVTALHFKSAGAWTAYTLPAGTGGDGVTITVGTADALGGSQGDLYIQRNTDNHVIALWLNLPMLGWTEYPLELRLPRPTATTMNLVNALTGYQSSHAVPDEGYVFVAAHTQSNNFSGTFQIPAVWIRALATVENAGTLAFGTNVLSYSLGNNRSLLVGWNAAGNLIFGVNNANISGNMDLIIEDVGSD